MVSKKESSCSKGNIVMEHKKKMKNILSQIIASCSKYLIMLNIGMGTMFATIAIPVLLDSTDGLILTEDQASWYASLVYLMQPVGSITTVILSSFGRKRLMFYLQVPLFIAWLIPFFAQSVWHLYIASSVMGLGIGFMQAPIATYIGEVTQPHYRGWLASIAYCFLTMGGVVLYFMDVLIGDWRQTAIYSCVMPVFTALVLYFIPESPVWLVSKGRYEDAKEALKWLRGWASDEDVEQEYRTMVFQNSEQYTGVGENEGCGVETVDANTISGQLSRKNELTTEQMSHATPFWRYCLRPEMYKPMILTLIFMYLSNGTGTGAFKNYVITILESFKISLNEHEVNLYVACFGLTGNILCVIVMPIVGKRPLTFTSVGLTMLGMLALGLYAIFGNNLDMSWVPILLLSEIFLTTNLAIGHIPWIFISEIFPLRGRTFATGLLAGLGNALQFIGTKMFYTYEAWFSLGGVFVMYAITYFLGLIYLYYFLVETEGRSLNDIVDGFKGKGKRKGSARRASLTVNPA